MSKGRGIVREISFRDIQDWYIVTSPLVIHHSVFVANWRYFEGRGSTGFLWCLFFVQSYLKTGA